MKGYFGRDDLTAETFVDGWFRTGDIGELNAEGFLKITGRKKEIIVTSGGKNVVPALLEDQIRADAIVSQCVVIGDQRPFIAAIVTIDEEALPQWGKAHGLSAGISVAAAAKDPIVIAAVQGAVSRANSTVSAAEAIKQFRIVDTDFTETSGHLTPSMKVKRAQVLKDFETVVDEIYLSKKPV